MKIEVVVVEGGRVVVVEGGRVVVVEEVVVEGGRVVVVEGGRVVVVEGGRVVVVEGGRVVVVMTISKVSFSSSITLKSSSWLKLITTREITNNKKMNEFIYLLFISYS